MKPKFFLFLIASAVMISSNAQQCGMTIPPWPGSVQINTNSNITGEGMVYWICTGTHVTVDDSEGSVFLLEEYASITFNNASGEQVFAKNYSGVINNSDAAIVVNCNSTLVTLDNQGSGSIIVGSFCPAVTFDYSLVGGSACFVAGVEEPAATKITVFPNPAPAGSNIQLDGDFSSGENTLQLYDVYGKLVKMQPIISNVFSTEGLAPGTYFLTLHSNKGIQRSTLILY